MNPVSHAHAVPMHVQPWIETLARAGYAAKGIVYMTVGSLALQTAFGHRQQTADSKDALLEILSAPHGKILLSLMAIGLLGYTLWKWVEAIYDPDEFGRDAKGIIRRIGHAVSGVIYLGLALWAIGLVMGNGGGSGDSTPTWSAKLMSQPYGRWLVGLVGAAIIGFALHQLYQAYRAQFQYKFKRGVISENQREWAIRLGRIGHAARGVVFIMIGGFFIQAAIRHDPNETGGIGKALQELAVQPYGPWLLAAVAAGLVAYGIYCLIEGWLRRFTV